MGHFGERSPSPSILGGDGMTRPWAACSILLPILLGACARVKERSCPTLPPPLVGHYLASQRAFALVSHERLTAVLESYSAQGYLEPITPERVRRLLEARKLEADGSWMTLELRQDRLFVLNSAFAVSSPYGHVPPLEVGGRRHGQWRARGRVVQLDDRTSGRPMTEPPMPGTQAEAVVTNSGDLLFLPGSGFASMEEYLPLVFVRKR